VNAQARHMKKPGQLIEKQAYNPFPCQKILRIATTPRYSVAKETCSSMEGSRSERDTSNSSSANPSSEFKKTRNDVRIQTYDA